MTFKRLESGFFRFLNGAIEPFVRIGFGSPAPCGSGGGLIVLESKRQQTGRTAKIPLVAISFGDLMVVSTVRARRSKWLRNLRAMPAVHYWAYGRERDAVAFVVDGKESAEARAELPAPARSIASLLSLFGAGQGLAFAILIPATA